MVYNLLIVDDETQSRTTLANCFPWNQVGFEVVGQFSNGKMALDFMKNNTVHVLLCDICMPLITGIEMITILNTWDTSPITVFFSAYRNFEYAQQAMALGVRFYMLKPIKYEDLIHTFSIIKQELDIKHHVYNRFDCIQDNFIEKVHNYVNNNLDKASLKGLADYLYMNSSYVSQLYKQKTNQNFSDYLLEVRMSKASELLITSDKKIYTIGNMVGYSNQKNFSRAFLSFHGVTPTDFRVQHRRSSTEGENTL